LTTAPVPGSGLAGFTAGRRSETLAAAGVHIHESIPDRVERIDLRRRARGNPAGDTRDGGEHCGRGDEDAGWSR
jgi:hypothetical protein